VAVAGLLACVAVTAPVTGTVAWMVAWTVAWTVASTAASTVVWAATTERIVVDWHTGLAINGYDPVAFFTDGQPIPGSPDFEFHYGGAIWRFRNVGNREAFAARPDVYMPRFGGYDPLGVAHGVAVAGNPSVWSIIDGRLFLFYDQARLAVFTADAQRIASEAERKWPDVLRALSP
jgi:hypothetical protein